MKTLRLGTCLLATLVSVAACNGILGITEASVDPTLASDSGVANVDSAPPVDPNSCQAYCDGIAAACTGKIAEYIPGPTCNTMCALFEPGNPGEQTNDSLACRRHYVELAKASPTIDCQHAGPLGSGPCVPDPCSSFCGLALDLCVEGLAPYPNFDACHTACQRWPYLTVEDAGPGTVGDILFSGGNTLNCRLYHLESAFGGDTETAKTTAKTTHCGHLKDPSTTCR